MYVVLFDDLRQSKGITETVSSRSRYLLGNSLKPFQTVPIQSLEGLRPTCITSLIFYSWLICWKIFKSFLKLDLFKK